MNDRRFLILFLFLLICQLVTLGLWFADSGALGDPTTSRLALNGVMLMVCGLALKPELKVNSQWEFLAMSAFGITIFLFFQNIPSRISGLPFSILEKFEVLLMGSAAEEFFFRGLVWKYAMHFFSYSKIFAPLLLSSILFGIYHLGYWSHGFDFFTLQHVGGAFVAGLFFGAIRFKSNKIFWAAIAHILENSFVLLMRLL